MPGNSFLGAIVRLRILMLLASCLSVASAAVGAQDRISLNGLWEIQVRTDRLEPTPPTAGWEAVPIRIPSPFNHNGFTNGAGADFRHFPSYPDHWDDALAAWHRRTVRIPVDWSGGRIFLCFEASHLRTVVYLDGVLLGENRDGFLPFEFDLTDLVGPGGEYSLTVGVESSLLLAEGENGRIPDPHGSFWGRENAGIWGDVALVRRPTLRIDSVKIVTSVRDATAVFEYKVRNDASLPLSPSIAFRIREASTGLEVKSGGLPSAQVPAKGAITRRIVIDWPDARFWSPDDPFLYYLEYDLRLGVTEIDSATERFGFREFESSGGDFYLNGVKTRLLADSWHWMGIAYQDPEYARAWYALAKDSQLNCIRLHAQVYPKFYLDLADEMGMMIIGESAHWGSAADILYRNETWDRLREQWVRLLDRDRNHPSIVLWSLANEIIPGSEIDPFDELDGSEEYLEEMSALIELVNGLDGTRPLMAEGDFDGYGLFEIINFHYPGPQFGEALNFWRTFHRPVSIGEAGPMFYVEPREVCPWRGPSTFLSYNGMLESTADNLVWLIENYRLWAEHVSPFNLVWYGLEPLEFSGDPIEYESLETPGAKPERIGPYSRTFNAGADPDLPEYILNPVGKAIRSAMKKVALIPAEQDARFFGGARIKRTFHAVNDLPRAATFTVDWGLKVSGEQILDGSVLLFIPPAEDRLLTLDLALPEVEVRSPAMLMFQIAEPEEGSASREIPLEIWPLANLIERLESREKRLYDPAGRVDLAQLSQVGWIPIEDLEEATASTDEVLVIGPGAGLTDPEQGELFAYTRGGGRVLFLEENPTVLPDYAATYEPISPDQPAVWFAYPNGDHPLTSNLTAGDLRHWGTDNDLLVGVHRDVSIGNAASPVVSGCGGAALIDLPIGSGRLILSNLKLGEKSDEHPVALELLVRAIEHLEAAPAPRFRSTTFDGPKNSSLKSLLLDLGALIESESSTNGQEAVQLVDASDADWTGERGREILAGFLSGATEESSILVLWGLTQEAADSLSSLLPEAIEVAAADHPFLIPQGDLLEGVYIESTYWLGPFPIAPSVTEAGMLISPSELREDHLIAPPFDWRTQVFEAETTRTAAILRSERENPPVPLSGVSSYRLGEKRLVLCWLRTDIGNPRIDSLVSAFLTRLGVGIDPFRPTPDLNSDDRFDGLDVFTFARGWLQLLGFSKSVDRSDFSRDGRISGPDLTSFLERGATLGTSPFEGPSLRDATSMSPKSKAEFFARRRLATEGEPPQ